MTFEEKLITLNPAQRDAVESIEGPVMVIAGPGTGKTEILSLRIGYILRNTQVSPGNILCLTYTDAAATEMRHRLIDFIGPEAYRIFVSTFHSFCNLVIQENPSVFQQARELEPISEIDKFKLLQELIDDFSPDHPLKKFKGNAYSDWKRLGDLFATMKKENWSSVYMLEQIEEYVYRMRQSDEFIYKRKSGDNQKGDFKEKDFREKILNKMEALTAAAAEYDHFNDLLSERGQYDFDDMLLWVNKAFDQNPDLLANYQERFLYFLVDEFQDTNGIQIALLKKLIDHEWLDQPNVFVVGDDDQAIYRFQGANIENLIQFHDRYHPKVIFLKDNYRSSQHIIDASRVVMQSVDNSLMQKIFKQIKTLTASGPHSKHEQQVIVQSYPTLSYENADIFRQLLQWHEGDHGEIAVLYSKHELGRELAQALKGAGIPYHSVKTLDALSQPLIIHLLEIVQCIHQLSDGPDNDDGLLYRVLHLRYLKPSTVDLQRLIMDYTSKERTDTSTFFTWLGNSSRLDQLNLRDREWIDRAFHLMENGIIEYHSRTLLSFVEWVIHEFGMMSWILHQPEKFTYLYTLKTFFNFIDQEAAGKKSFRVTDLLEICDLMTTYQIRLPVQELARNNKGIFLSSLHGAKGMQFDKVIIKNVTENEWEKKRPYSFSFSYPDNLVRHEDLSDAEESEMDNDDQDRRRLLYVGMTRAKKELLLTYSMAKDDGKGLIPSLYLTELEQGQPGILRSKSSADETLLAEYLTSFMSGEQRVELYKDDAEIRERVKNYILNVSALNTYLECPLKFYYEKILVIPSGEAAPLLFGTALHDALQRYFRKRYEEKDSTKGKSYLTDMYGWFMERNRHRFTSKEMEDLTIYGKRILGQFYDNYHQSWSDHIRYELEYKIQDVHIKGVPVKGFIDRLDRIGDSIMVFDYKSGKADTIAKKLKGPDAKDPIGGQYWRQMVFYDLLLSEDARLKRGMTMGYIQALEPLKDGSFVEKKVAVTEADREFVTNQIVETYQKIQNLEFEKGCGECEWCSMHDLVVPFPRDESIEEG